MAFIDDIQSRDTALFPVVTFNLLDYRIGTKQFTLDGEHYSPLLLSSPSIKESIDLENRKYKISNVSLKISNVKYNGLRFTDTQIPLNTEVLIHWVSPSCTTMDECYLAYKGTVRAITHDEKTCNITLEDISQSTLHRDVPVTLLGTDDDVINKYVNKPMPMVYGSVDRSPTIIKVGGALHMTIHTDITDHSTKVNGVYDDGGNITNSPLYINIDDRYVTVPSVDEDIINEFGFRDTRQYENSDGSEQINMKYPIAHHDFEDDESITAPLLPSSIGGIFVSYEDGYASSDGDYPVNFYLNSDEDVPAFFSRDYTYPSAITDRPEGYDEALVTKRLYYDYSITYISESIYQILFRLDSGVDNEITTRTQANYEGNDAVGDINALFNLSPNPISGEEARYNSSRISIVLTSGLGEVTGSLSLTNVIIDRTVRHLVSDISKRDFYANVIGRVW